ncbi:MAG: ketoacyl-ACP synthase III [Opitutales bacterium]|nr:ketoacyl-ACP synthase III [Opitutales bacterium]
MANFRFNGIGIRAISACVPAEISRNEDALKNLVPAEEIEKTITAIGIREKRIAPQNVCASDLCFAAAEKLFADNPEISRESIDVLLFMSQTADYRTPATSVVLQHRLGLSQNCAAMDLSLACSGYVYALSVAFAYANLPTVRRVLLLDGETYTKVVNPRDRVNAPLYGDAGTATLIEKSETFGEACFVLKTDGSGENAVKIPAGAFRLPASAETLAEKTDKEGNIRSDCEVFMNGMDVFNFAIRSVPSVMKETAEFAGFSPSEADGVVFHQAHRMMTDFLAARMRIPSEKILYSLHKYGNTSSASIPLTISECGKNLSVRERIFICGFGAGLSWGAATLSLSSTKISPVIDYHS